MRNPIFVQVKEGDTVKSVYDLRKISFVYRIDNTSIKVIIDGVEEIFSYDDQVTCDNSFSWIVKNLLALCHEAV